MGKYIFVDRRIRKIEEDTLKKMGYKIIKVSYMNSVYEEISSHVDIFILKLDDTLIIQRKMYEELLKSSSEFNEFLSENSINKKVSVVVSDEVITQKYPNDIKFNVCNISNNAIHNFKYTDKLALRIIEEKKLNKININQGYSNCSIAVVDDNSCVVTDKSIYQKLKANAIDVLLVENVERKIKLLDASGKKYSNMHGFIGGTVGRLDNKVIIFGDLNYIDSNNLIRNFLKAKNLEIVEFKNLEVIDYGGIILI